MQNTGVTDLLEILAAPGERYLRARIPVETAPIGLTRVSNSQLKAAQTPPRKCQDCDRLGRCRIKPAQCSVGE